jgi:hypothetical protein
MKLRSIIVFGRYGRATDQDHCCVCVVTTAELGSDAACINYASERSELWTATDEHAFVQHSSNLDIR